jgi:hypothetical protein
MPSANLLEIASFAFIQVSSSIICEILFACLPVRAT